jgi:hypothetical protein
MRAVLIATLMLATALSGASAVSGELTNQSAATVTLVVENPFTSPLGLDSLPGTAACGVTVLAGANGGDVLESALENGCILEWDFDEFDGDRFVSSIDGLRGLCPLWPDVCFFWLFSINDTPASHGIDGYAAADGDTVTFTLIQA